MLTLVRKACSVCFRLLPLPSLVAGLNDRIIVRSVGANAYPTVITEPSK